MFSNPLPVGQLYFPDFPRYEAAMKAMFDRKYYTNQGPMCSKLENEIEDFLGVSNAICVTNATIGLMMAAEALQLSGKVLVPSFTFIASAQSLSLCGLRPVFCDVDSRTHQITTDTLDAAWEDDISAVLAVNLWGGACDVRAISHWANVRSIPLYFDSAQAFGCEVENHKVGNFGHVEVFSFHATKIVSASEGGCICTNDDELAARLRNIRSSYGAGQPISVVKTANGRMSEAQATIASLSLEDFPINQERNAVLHSAYVSGSSEIDGMKIISPPGVSRSNFQSAVAEIDKQKFGLSRDLLLRALQAENIIARRYFFPGVHRSRPFLDQSDRPPDLPNTDALNSRCLQLPLGARVNVDTVRNICELIGEIGNMSPAIRRRYER